MEIPVDSSTARSVISSLFRAEARKIPRLCLFGVIVLNILIVLNLSSKFFGSLLFGLATENESYIVVSERKGGKDTGTWHLSGPLLCYGDYIQ